MKRISGPDLLMTGIYTIPQVAELVSTPQSMVRIWVEGHTGKQVAVIDNQLGRVGGKVACPTPSRTNPFANRRQLTLMIASAMACAVLIGWLLAGSLADLLQREFSSY